MISKRNGVGWALDASWPADVERCIQDDPSLLARIFKTAGPKVE